MWLAGYEKLVNQLEVLTELLKSCFKILKQQGLSKQTIASIEKSLVPKEVPSFFKKGVGLRVASYGKTEEEEEIIKMMTGVKIADVSNWKTQNLLPSMNPKRKKLYQNCG